MNRYTNIKVNVSEGQKDKIKRAIEAGMGVNIDYITEIYTANTY